MREWSFDHEKSSLYDAVNSSNYILFINLDGSRMLFFIGDIIYGGVSVLTVMNPYPLDRLASVSIIN